MATIFPTGAKRSLPPSLGDRKTVKLDSRERSSEFRKLYEITGVVGVGGGGTVYAGTRRFDGLKIAIKQVPKTKVKRWGRVQGRMVPIEFELLDKVSDGHKGIVQMIDWYERRSSYVLVMERPERHIDLFDYLNKAGPIKEPVVRDVFIQILDAIIHCHNNGVLHRDIKDENILLSKRIESDSTSTFEAKLIDFGCGTRLKEQDYTEFAGTPEFYPPEWFRERRYNGKRASVWSLGVLLFTMTQGEVPFPKERDITRCELRFKPAIPVARHIREFIRWLLNPDERNRPTFNDIQQHAWIKEGRERTERNSTGL
jgi:serine/threonine protein kinase